MKVNVQWDNEEHKIVRYIFEQGWAWPDLHQALDEAGKLINTVSHQVDVIMDISSANLVPKGALSQINRAYNNPKPPNIGITVIVAPNSFMSAMVNMAKKIWGNKTEWQLEFVNTLDEAYQIIKNSSSEKEKTLNG